MPDALPTSTRIARRLIPLATALLLLPALVPWWVVVLPRLDFDVDPRSPGAEVITTLGPAGFGALAVLGTLAALFALLVHGLSGGSFAWKSALLLLPGLWTLAMWMPVRYENLWHGTGWTWAIAAGLAAAQLGQWPVARRWATAILAGFAAMLLIEALNYRFTEHAATVAMFEQQRDTFLQARGWDAGSAEAQLYERRLRTNDAIGAIGLSNVLATLAAGLGVMGLGMFGGSLRVKPGQPMDVAAWRTFGGDASLRMVVSLGVFVIAAGVVALTNSTAGMAALGIGCAWVTGLAIVRAIAAGTGRSSDQPERVLSALSALACVALVYGAVGLRYVVWGVPGPGEVGDGIGGELSVLFRAQYWGAAWRMLTELPGAWLIGVGPGGFGDMYLRFKSPLNPEEVTNAHSFVVDFVAMLGLGGALWCGVLLGWLGRGSWGCGTGRLSDPSGGERLGGMRGVVYGLLLVGGVWVGLELWVAWDEVAGPGAAWGLAWRLAALGGFVAVGTSWWRYASDAGIRLGLVGAAVAVLVHGSFDMAFFQPTSAVVMWMVVGLAGACALQLRPSKPMRVPGRHAIWVWLVMSCCLLGQLVSGAMLADYEASLRKAADRVRAGETAAAIEGLMQAQRGVRFDPSTLRAMTSLVGPGFSLGDASAALRVAMIDPGYVADFRDEGWLDAPWRVLEAAGPWSDAFTAAVGHAGVYRLLSGVAWLDGQLDLAIEVQERAVTYSPMNMLDRVRLGDLQVQQGEHERAAASYREALRLDDLRYLDPAKRMGEAERARIEGWLAAYEAGL